MDFTTKLSGHHVSIYNKDIEYDHEIYAKLTIDWQFYTEMRDWGVKTIGVYVTKIYGDINITNYDDDSELGHTFSDKGWNVESYTDELTLQNSIAPQDVEIDYATKTITINF